jgi:hypothetical protein
VGGHVGKGNPLTAVDVDGLGCVGKLKKRNKKKMTKPKTETANPPKKQTQWQYITAWHDKRATELFGEGKGKSVGGRSYDKSYKGRDIEYKLDNFKRPRTPNELNRMSGQIDKDRVNSKTGDANPYWHFEHDSTQAPEMKPLLDKLDQSEIP